MGALLKNIEIENFKSFKGVTVIGPLKKVTAIIGSNGSGKSNFIDAISFVMGEKICGLHVKSLGELIHGAINGRQVSNRCSVTAHLELENGTQIELQRSVINSSAEYKINGTNVNSSTYIKQLKSLGINMETKNLRKNTVESIATQNAKERAALFEELSGSVRLKADYNRLKHEMLHTAYSCKKRKYETEANNQEADRCARKEFENAAKKAKLAFETIKNMRFAKFIECYDYISEVVDKNYKSLTADDAGQAHLWLGDYNEPFLNGISFSCIPPGKRLHPMEALGAGEKTMAALALFFAIVSFLHGPFLVLDAGDGCSIDAGLDIANTGKVASYIATRDQQTIIVSSNANFYRNADSIIEISPQPGDCFNSKVCHVDLISPSS